MAVQSQCEAKTFRLTEGNAKYIKKKMLNMYYAEFICKNINRASKSSLLLACSKSVNVTAQKMKFSIKDFFSKCDQIRSLLRIWPHLLKKSLMENFIFCAVCDIFI